MVETWDAGPWDTAMAGMLILAAVLLFVPMIADPYQLPRLLPVLIGSAGLACGRARYASALTRPVALGLGAVLVCWWRAQDVWAGAFGAYMFNQDGVLAYACYAAVLLGVAEAGLGLDRVTRMIAAASIPMSLYAVAQRFIRDPLLYHELPAGRVVSTQGGPIFLGAALAIAGMCALRLALRRERLGVVALALVLPALVYAQTRGAILALAVGAAFHFPLPAAAGATVLVAFVPRALSLQSDLGRVETWKTAWRVFEAYPLTGYGPGNFLMAFRRYSDWRFVEIMRSALPIQAHGHNEVLHVAATLGLMGLVAYAVLVTAVLRLAWEHQERRWLLGLLAAYAVLAAVNPVPASVLVLMAALLGAASAVPIEPGWLARLLRPARAFGCVLMAGVLGRLCWANYHHALGVAHEKRDLYQAAVHFNRAAQLNPWEIVLTCRQVDALYTLLHAAAPGQVQAMAGAGHELARLALKKHPMESYAHELYGKTHLVAYMAGLPVNPLDGLREFNRAQALAPTMEALMWRRRITAVAAHDAGEVARADADIAQLRAALAKRRA